MTHLWYNIYYLIYKKAHLLVRVLNRAIYKVIILPPCSPGAPPGEGLNHAAECNLPTCQRTGSLKKGQDPVPKAVHRTPQASPTPKPKGAPQGNRGAI